jgi:uncharacterized membrane protein
METLRKLLYHPEFIAVLFILCTALFGWPFISITGPSSPVAMFIYLFVVWAAVIALLSCIAWSADRKSSIQEPGSES